MELGWWDFREHLDALAGQEVRVQIRDGQAPAAILAELRGPLAAPDQREFTDGSVALVLGVGLVDLALAGIEESAWGGASWIEEAGGKQLRVLVGRAELWLFFETPAVRLEGNET